MPSKKDETEVMKFTKYEKARMLGSRALQLAMGAPFLIKLSDDDLQRLHYNPIEIAKIEFSEGVLPISVRRPMPGKRHTAEDAQEQPKDAAEAKEAA